MNFKKNILFMVGGSYVAGAEITNLNLLRDLHHQGYDILVVVSGWNDGDFIQRLSNYQIPFKIIKLGFIHFNKPLWTLDTLINYPKAFLQLRQIINRFNPSWIFHSSYRSFLVGYILFRKYKNIYREHDDPIISKNNIKLYRFLNKKIHRFVCPSQMVKNKLCQLGVIAEKVMIIPSPLDPEFTNNQTTSKTNNDITNIGIIGQIIPRKGFDFLFSEIAKLNINFVLSIYGDDVSEYAKKLKQNIPTPLENKIKWMGYIKNRLEIYQDLDIVIFPSLSESFGRIIIEAAAFGIPTIASDISCFKEIIKHDETGLIFKLSDTGELASFLEQLILNVNRREKMGENAKKYALSNFTSEKCTEKFKTLLNE